MLVAADMDDNSSADGFTNSFTNNKDTKLLVLNNFTICKSARI
jgi:hypothetical protein